MKPWANNLSVGVLVANLCFLVFWLAVDRHATGPDHAVVSNSYDAISLQITILGIIITAMAIGLGVISIFGYQALREAMLSRTESLINSRLDNHPAFAKGGLTGGPPGSPPPPGEVTAESANL